MNRLTMAKIPTIYTCDDSPLKGGKSDDRDEEGRKDPPEPEKVVVVVALRYSLKVSG